MEFYWALKKASSKYETLERLGNNPAFYPKEGYPTGRPGLATPAGQDLKPDHLLRVWFSYTVPLPCGCLIFVLFAHILALLQKLSWPLKREDVYHTKNKSIIWVETRHELGLSGVASWQPFKLTSFSTSVIALHRAQKNVCKHKEVQLCTWCVLCVSRKLVTKRQVLAADTRFPCVQHCLKAFCGFRAKAWKVIRRKK